MDYYLLREVFSQVKCKDCATTFEPAGIDVLHEGRNFALLRISCLDCKQVAGVAIVRFGPTKEAATRTERGQAISPDLSDRDRQRFTHLAPITSDDVIAAHRYIHAMEASWRSGIPADRLPPPEGLAS